MITVRKAERGHGRWRKEMGIEKTSKEKNILKRKRYHH